MSSHCKDVDEFLKNSDNPEADFRYKLESAVPVKNQAGNPGLIPDHYSFQSFQPIGEFPDGRILIFSNVNQKSYELTLKELNAINLRSAYSFDNVAF